MAFLPSAVEGMPWKVFQEPEPGGEEPVGAQDPGDRGFGIYRCLIRGSRAKAFSFLSEPVDQSQEKEQRTLALTFLSSPVAAES